MVPRAPNRPKRSMQLDRHVSSYHATVLRGEVSTPSQEVLARIYRMQLLQEKQRLLDNTQPLLAMPPSLVLHRGVPEVGLAPGPQRRVQTGDQMSQPQKRDGETSLGRQVVRHPKQEQHRGQEGLECWMTSTLGDQHNFMAESRLSILIIC